jgi:hypothetical protein
LKIWVQTEHGKKYVWDDVALPGNPTGKMRGANERKLCGRCGEEIPKRAQRWCSRDCGNEHFFERFRPEVLVIARDGKRCALCGLDIEALEDRLQRMRSRNYHSWHRHRKRIDRILQSHGWDIHKRLYEIDHVVARRDGGCDLPLNLRVLCVPCHKGRTKKQVREWARQRRPQLELTI